MKNPLKAISFIVITLSLFTCHQQKETAMVYRKSAKAEALNHKLAQGWNTWNTRSALSHVLLPQSFAINLQLKDAASDSVLKEALIGRRGKDAEIVTPGPHAYDGSYTALTVDWRNNKVNVNTAANGKDLAIIITQENTNQHGELLINPKILWGGKGSVKMLKDGLSFTNDSLQIRFRLQTKGNITVNDSMIVCSLTDKVILSTYNDKSVTEIESIVSAAAKKLTDTKNAYGTNGDLYDAMQTVLAWDIIYEPTKQNVISPVSRIWNCNWNGWVLFDWDTYFAAYMYSLDNKDLAYANAIAITKEISKKGFIPNFASSLGTSEDRSEPPVGSFIIWKIYERYKEKWFLEEVFNELLTWNRWWESNRDVKGYLVWGSDPYDSGNMPGWLTKEIGKRQAAMWESGLDNSPMFDGATYDTAQHRLMLADAGLMSMVIWDSQYLSKIAKELGKDDISTELEKRAAKYTKNLASLYDSKTGMYLNKNLVSGDLSHRLSPTLFYPLLAKAASQEQAERMIKEHFYNPDEFWGDWVIPSISRNDSAFKDNNYWRGRIWAPMNFLVYCGMKNYNLPDARRDLVERSKELLLKSWRNEHHVYENYNSVNGTGDDVSNSDKFYHWGALLAFMTLLEAQTK